MFDRLRALFEEGAGHEVAANHADELEVAVAALLVEIAGVDDSLDEAGRRLIRQLLERRFGLSAEQAATLEAAAERRANESAQLFGFARTITENLPRERRLDVIELLWEVAYADGVLDPLEDSLLRRIGGLIDVSDHERGAARLRVLARLGLKEEE
jgi:uncharacterized tellurite resistance protein B-like protein